MRKMFYLSTCDTCRRIMQAVDPGSTIPGQDIKSDPLTEEQLESMRRLAGSYEALFSRRARKYRALGLHEQKLNEEDYRRLLLEEYTFLKRPVLIWDEQIFIGNTKKSVAAMKEAIQR